MTETSTDAAVQGFHDIWREMTVRFRGGSYDVDGGVARMRTGLPVPMFNGVWVVDEPATAASVLAAVADFESGELPWNLQLRPGYPVELDQALADAGLVVTGDIPFMVLSDPSRLPAAADGVGLARRAADSFRDLDHVLSLLEQGFDMPVELTRERFPVSFFCLPDSVTWIGSVNGYDVTTAFGAVRRGLCGVFNVATPAAERGRGYGGAITAATVLEAFNTGARGAFLQSSPMGYPVYERLGFVTVEEWRQWMPQRFVEAH